MFRNKSLKLSKVCGLRTVGNRVQTIKFHHLVRKRHQRIQMSFSRKQYFVRLVTFRISFLTIKIDFMSRNLQLGRWVALIRLPA